MSPGMRTAPRCAICANEREYAFSARVLKHHTADYWYCPACGLLQVHDPVWLAEAYGAPIAAADTGLVQRNLWAAVRITSLVFLAFDRRARYLDVAGGYGLLTRLLRDAGLDFYWQDDHCPNLHAVGFEADLTANCEPFAAITAIEVLGHLMDPVEFLSRWRNLAKTTTIMFTTELFDDSPPHPAEWWYYSFETGQHVSFYQRRTLKALADVLGLQLYSRGALHIFTDKPINRLVLRICTGPSSLIISRIARHQLQSLTFQDHHRQLSAAAAPWRDEPDNGP